MALFGPSIHGSVIFMGPATSPSRPNPTSAEPSDPDLVTLRCVRIARFSRRVRVVGGEAGGESTRVDGSVGGGRFTMGILGDVGTDMGKGSATWSGVGIVGDGEARKRAPLGFGMKESDMVCWDFSARPSTSLYTTSALNFDLRQTSLRTFSQVLRLFRSKICAKSAVFAPILRSLNFLT